MTTSVIMEARHVIETVLDESNPLSNEKLVCGGRDMGLLTQYFPSMHKGLGSICCVWFCNLQPSSQKVKKVGSSSGHSQLYSKLEASL